MNMKLQLDDLWLFIFMFPLGCCSSWLCTGGSKEKDKSSQRKSRKVQRDGAKIGGSSNSSSKRETPGIGGSKERNKSPQRKVKPRVDQRKVVKGGNASNSRSTGDKSAVIRSVNNSSKQNMSVETSEKHGTRRTTSAGSVQIGDRDKSQRVGTVAAPSVRTSTRIDPIYASNLISSSLAKSSQTAKLVRQKSQRVGMVANPPVRTSVRNTDYEAEYRNNPAINNVRRSVAERVGSGSDTSSNRGTAYYSGSAPSEAGSRVTGKSSAGGARYIQNQEWGYQ